MIITKSNKDCAKKLDFKDKFFMAKFPVKVRDIHKIEKKNSIGISIFGQQNEEKHPIYMPKNAEKEKMLIYY